MDHGGREAQRFYATAPNSRWKFSATWAARASFIDGEQVGRVIEDAFFFGVWQAILHELSRERHVRGVGFHEEPMGGNVAEDLATLGFAFVQEMAREGKIRAEFYKTFHHFKRAAVGVEQEAALRDGLRAENLRQQAPRFEAMDADREVLAGGKGELPREDLGLVADVEAVDPAVEPDFANARAP